MRAQCFSKWKHTAGISMLLFAVTVPFAVSQYCTSVPATGGCRQDWGYSYDVCSRPGQTGLVCAYQQCSRDYPYWLPCYLDCDADCVVFRCVREDVAVEEIVMCACQESGECP
jgi:hypothetical protein